MPRPSHLEQLEAALVLGECEIWDRFEKIYDNLDRVEFTGLDGIMREFETGATRDSDDGKHDPEGFLSPWVIDRFDEYMHQNRVQTDGSLRASDNWQKGIPKDQYMKSLWRHFLEVWKLHRTSLTPGKIRPEDRDEMEDALCAMMFNTMGYLHALLGE